MVQTAESHAKTYSDTRGHLTSYTNGQLSFDEDIAAVMRTTQTADGECHTAVPAMMDGAAAAPAVAAGRQAGFWGTLDSCLSSAGVPAWLVAAALVACGSTGPAGVVVCLIGAGIGAGTAYYCFLEALNA